MQDLPIFLSVALLAVFRGNSSLQIVKEKTVSFVELFVGISICHHDQGAMHSPTMMSNRHHVFAAVPLLDFGHWLCVNKLPATYPASAHKHID